MIVDSGSLKLLTSQLSYLATTEWILFTNNVVISETTVFTDLTEATWGGYARQTSGTWSAATLVTPRAVSQLMSNVTFNNTSGSPQNFFGWAIIDPPGPTLIAAQNLGAQVLPDGQSYVLAPAVTDKEE